MFFCQATCNARAGCLSRPGPSNRIQDKTWLSMVSQAKPMLPAIVHQIRHSQIHPSTYGSIRTIAPPNRLQRGMTLGWCHCISLHAPLELRPASAWGGASVLACATPSCACKQQLVQPGADGAVGNAPPRNRMCSARTQHVLFEQGPQYPRWTPQE